MNPNFLFQSYAPEQVTPISVKNDPRGYTYEIYSANEPIYGLEFLESIPRHLIPKLYYIIVETPKMNLGLDCICIFDEKTGEPIDERNKYLNHSAEIYSLEQEASAILQNAKISREQFQNRGDRIALDKAIQILENSLYLIKSKNISSVPYTSFNILIPAIRNELGGCYRDLFFLENTEESLENSIINYEIALNRLPVENELFPFICNNLANSLKDRFHLMWEIDDLKKAKNLYEKASSAKGIESETKFLFEVNWGSSQRDFYFYVSQNPSDLTLAIDILENISLPKENNLIVNDYYNALGTAYLDHYRRTGKIILLNNSIAQYEKAVEIFSVNPTTEKLLNSYIGVGICNLELFNRFEDLKYLDTAIESLESTLNSTFYTANLFLYYSSLGKAYYISHIIREDFSSLEKSATFYKLAVENCHVDSPHFPPCILGFAECLSELALYKRGHERETTFENIEKLLQSIFKQLEKNPLYQIIAYNIKASIFYVRFKKNHIPTSDFVREVLSPMLSILDDKKKINRPEAELRLLNNSGIIAMELNEWELAAQIYMKGIDLIEGLYNNQLTWRFKESWLKEIQSFPNNAAIALIKDHKFEKAVAALEAGRAWFLKESIQKDLSKLDLLDNSGNKDLAESFRRNSQKLNFLQRSNIFNPQLKPEILEAEILETKRKNEILIREIRNLSGFESFLMIPKVTEIQSVLRNYPGFKKASILYIVESEFGYSLLLVGADSIKAKVKESSREINQAVSAWQQSKSFNATQKRNLNTLGVELIDEILTLTDSFYKKKEQEDSLLILIPCGRFSSIPFHVIWKAQNNKPFYLIDKFNLTYTPTADLLIQNLNQIYQIPQHSVSLFAIGNPLPSTMNPIPDASVEVEEIAKFFSKKTILVNEEAQIKTFKTHFGNSTIFHFAGHGSFDSNNYLKSSLYFSDDKQLTLEEIIHLEQFKHTRLVVLSACESGVVDTETIANESFGLSTAFLSINVPGTIGSFWKVDDFSTSLLFIKFYELLSKNLSKTKYFTTPIKELRQAQIWLRELDNETYNQYQIHAKRYLFIDNQPFDFRSNQYPFADPYSWGSFGFFGC